MTNSKSFTKLVIFTLVYSFLTSIVLISFIWLSVNLSKYGFSIGLYRNYIYLELYLYILLGSFLTISILLTSVILPRSRFKKLSGTLGWLLIIGCFSFIGYLYYITEIAPK